MILSGELVADFGKAKSGKTFFLSILMATSRRWLCHLVSNIDNPCEWNLDYEQFYAQLRHEYQHG